MLVCLCLLVLGLSSLGFSCPGPVGRTSGVAGWRGNSFIEISDIPSYPDTLPLPGPRNVGFVSGSGLLMTSTGFIVVDGGDYLTTLTAVLYGNETAPEGIEFNVFLILNASFNMTDNNLVGGSNTVGTNQVTQFQGTNILRLKRGDTLSLVINNGNGGLASIKLFAWEISSLKVST